MPVSDAKMRGRATVKFLFGGLAAAGFVLVGIGVLFPVVEHEAGHTWAAGLLVLVVLAGFLGFAAWMQQQTSPAALEGKTPMPEALMPMPEGITPTSDAGAFATNLQSMADNTTYGYFSLDKDYRYTAANTIFCQMAIRTKEQLLGQQNNHDPADAAKSKPLFARGMQGETIHYEGYNALSKAWFTMDIYPTGEGIAVFTRDTTQAHKGILEADKLKNLLQKCIDGTQDLVWCMDTNYKVIYTNEALKAAFAIIAPETSYDVEKPISDREVETWAYIKPYVDQALAGATCRCKYQYEIPSGIQYLEYFFYPVADENGKIEGTVCFIKDISVQLAIQQKMQDQLIEIERVKRDLQALIDSSSDLIFCLDKDLVYRYGNKSFEFAWTASVGSAPVIGAYNIDKVPAELWEVQEPYFMEALRGETVRFTLATPMPDGTSITHQYLIGPIFASDGSVLAIGCFVQDITNALQTRLTIQTQEEKLRKISWAQSHLVRGPVASILGLVHVYDRQNLDNPFNMQVLDHLKDVTLKLDSVVRNIVAEAAGGE